MGRNIKHAASRLRKKSDFVIASPAPASPGEAGASLPSPEVHEGRRSPPLPPLPPLREGEREGGREGKLAMTSFLLFRNLLGGEN
jgi:hypothetical protein